MEMGRGNSLVTEWWSAQTTYSCSLIADEVRIVHKALCSLVIEDSSSLYITKPKDPMSSISRGRTWKSEKHLPFGASIIDPYPSRTVWACGSIIALLIIICTGNSSHTTTTKPSSLCWSTVFHVRGRDIEGNRFLVTQWMLVVSNQVLLT